MPGRRHDEARALPASRPAPKYCGDLGAAAPRTGVRTWATSSIPVQVWVPWNDGLYRLVQFGEAIAWTPDAARVRWKAVQRMLGHVSAAMTLDISAGLFVDDLDVVAATLDLGARVASADWVRTNGPDGGGQSEA